MATALLLLFLCMLVAVATAEVWHAEAKKWNHGQCPRCNTEWVEYGSNALGDRVYRCAHGHHSIRISWPVDQYHA